MRKARIKVEGVPAVYHCITRVVGGAYLLGESEKEALRKQLWRAAGFCGVEILTYCLLDNHFHVLARVPPHGEASDQALLERAAIFYSVDQVEALAALLQDDDETVRSRCRAGLLARMGDVSNFMKELKQRFTIWFNKRHRRFGTLWAERFKSVLVQDDPFALATVAAYIDLNSVRAGLASDPASYRFCGYGEAMGGSAKARHGLRSVMNEKGDFSRAIERYRVVLFGKGTSRSWGAGSVNAEKASEVMASGGSVSRDEALRCRVRYFTDGVILGSPTFVQEVFERHRSQFGSRRRDGPRPLMGADWGGLSCARGLRRSVFG